MDDEKILFRQEIMLMIREFMFLLKRKWASQLNPNGCILRQSCLSFSLLIKTRINRNVQKSGLVWWIEWKIYTGIDINYLDLIFLNRSTRDAFISVYNNRNAYTTVCSTYRLEGNEVSFVCRNMCLWVFKFAILPVRLYSSEILVKAIRIYLKT